MSIFVFGSNLAGIHGAGAALWAVKNSGAIYGQGEGLQGDSYAIPTKDHSIRTLSLEDINKSVKKFLKFAESNPNLVFKVTPIGCGLAGYKPIDIAWMFEKSLPNVGLPLEFLEIIHKN